MNQNEQEMEIDILRLAKAVWRHAALVAAVSLICAVLGGLFTILFVDHTYEATVAFYIYNRDNETTNGTINATDMNVIEKLGNTYTEILKTRSSVRMILQAAEVDYEYKDFLKMIKADTINATSVYEITVVSKNAKEAADIANAIAHVMPEHITTIMQGGIMNILDAAAVPDKPMSRGTVRNAAIGFILGFVVVAGLIVVLELLDDKIHNTDYITQNFDEPMLAVIPDLMTSHGAKHSYGRAGSYARAAEKIAKD